MTGVLSARKYWCEPGEPILWAREETLQAPLFEVEGLDKNGEPSKNFASKALRAVGRGALGVTVGVAGAILDATSDNNYGGDSDKPTGPTFRDYPTVFGPHPECIAVQAVQPWRTKKLPGWEEIKGLWVLTPNRFGWLVSVEQVRKLEEQEEKGKPGFTGNLIGLAAGVASDTVKSFSENPPGKPIELPEVQAGVEVPRASITAVEVMFPFQEPNNEQAEVYLRVMLVDGSGFLFGIDRGPRVAMMMHSWISGG